MTELKEEEQGRQTSIADLLARVEAATMKASKRRAPQRLAGVPAE